MKEKKSKGNGEREKIIWMRRQAFSRLVYLFQRFRLKIEKPLLIENKLFSFYHLYFFFIKDRLEQSFVLTFIFGNFCEIFCKKIFTLFSNLVTSLITEHWWSEVGKTVKDQATMCVCVCTHWLLYFALSFYSFFFDLSWQNQ